MRLGLHLRAVGIGALALAGAHAATAQLIVTAPVSPAVTESALVVETPPVASVTTPQLAPAAPGANIVFATQLLELAAAYQSSMSAAMTQSALFTNAQDISQAVRLGATREQDQFQKGAVVFAAIAALQDPAFVAGMREYADDAEARELVAARLLANPAYIDSFQHVDSAAGLAAAALGGYGARAVSTGEAVKKAAYDIQRQAWSRAVPTNKEATLRLEVSRTLAGTPLIAQPEQLDLLRTASLGQTDLGLRAEPLAGARSPMVTHALALAALAMMGKTGEAQLADIEPLLNDAPAGFCLKMARLMFQQCLAGAHERFDDIFCVGEHAISDTGQCMVDAAGYPAQGRPAQTAEITANAG